MLTEHAGGIAAVYGGLFYVGTGSPAAGGSTTAMEVYDPTTNLWTSKAPITTSRASAGFGVIGTTLYAVGGCINSDCLAGLNGVNQAYDFVSDTWSAKTGLPVNLNNMASGVIGGKLLIAGGMGACGPCTALNTLYAYDPGLNSWSTKAAMPTATRSTASAVLNGILYVFGGVDAANTTVLGSVQAYDANSDTWSTKANMPTSRYAAGAAVLDGIIYVIGGNDGVGPLNTVEAYNPATDSWTTATSSPTARGGHVVGAIGSSIYVAGGSSGPAIAVLELFQ